MDPIEVQFYHSLHLDIPGTSLNGVVRCFIVAEVHPMPKEEHIFSESAGQVQILRIDIDDDAFSWLTVEESDLDSYTYDAIEERAYEIATTMLDYDSEFTH